MDNDAKQNAQPGTLYLVSTPIGNLRDISFRALDVLSSVDIILAEDTRKSKILLDHYAIKKPLKSYHDFNKEKITPFLIEQLKNNHSCAIISDAGTPGISDPGFYLVRQAIAENISVQAIPGATAFVPALVISGLPTDRFVFEGFLPVKKGRKKRIEQLKGEPRTMIFYESPHRLIKTLQDIDNAFGERRIAVAREMTKKFEEIVRGFPKQVLEYFGKSNIKGEFVIIVQGLSTKSMKI